MRAFYLGLMLCVVSSSAANANGVDCMNPQGTVEVNYCIEIEKNLLVEEFKKVEGEAAKYVASLEKDSPGNEYLDRYKKLKASYDSYVQDRCDYVSKVSLDKTGWAEQVASCEMYAMQAHMDFLKTYILPSD